MCTKCPIALALIDKGYEDVWVDDDFINVTPPNGRPITYNMPRQADLFINDFDNDYPVQVPLMIELTEVWSGD